MASTTEVQEPPSAVVTGPKAVEDETDEDQLDWKRQWYPVASIEALPKDRPHAITILGKNLVVWKDGQGEWRVFEDRCPHRQVALSEGRIEKDGTLMCSYHGWRWNGQGQCTSIPQVEPSKEARICAVSAACTTAYPTGSNAGLLWVWMTPGADAHLEAATTPIPCDSNNNSYFSSEGRNWYSRELPMSWEVLLENVHDPSHVPFSHHGVQGDRYHANTPVFTGVTGRGKEGYEVHGAWFRDPRTRRIAKFELTMVKAPTTYNINFLTPVNPEAERLEDMVANEKPAIRLTFRVAPVTPTTCRVISRGEAVAMAKDSWPARLGALKPRWLTHMTTNAVFDGDGIFLHRQSQDVLQGKVDPHADYFTPSSSDLGVRTLWSWLRRHARRGVDYYPDALEEGARTAYLPREAVLDRFHQHTKHCTACSAAYRNFNLALQAMPYVFAASVLAYAGLLGSGYAFTSPAGLACVAVGAAAGVARHFLRQVVRKFTFDDYQHAERN